MNAAIEIGGELAEINRARTAALEYLQLLTAGVPAQCHVELWQAVDRRTYDYPLDGLELAATHVAVYAGQIYVNVSGTRGKRDSHSRIHADDADFAFGVIVDGDVKDGAFASKSAAREFFDALTVRPSWVVDSGGGLQAFWRYSKVPQLDETSRADYAELARLWGAYVLAEAEKIGVHLDSTHDLARLMRIPGGINTKYGEPRLVLLDSVSDRHYSAETLRAKLPMPRQPRHAVSGESNSAPTMSDQQVLAQVRSCNNAEKFERLWHGDWKDTYPSPSEAVMALLCILAFHTRDEVQLEGLMLASGLGDEKRRRTLRRHDIPHALELVTETYSSGNGVPVTHGDRTVPAPELPEFPTQLLPRVMRDLVESEAHRLQLPAGMIALPCIVAAAGAIGGIRAVRTDDRIKSISLYAAVVAPIGHGKSAGINLAMSPLRAAARERDQVRMEMIRQARLWEKAKKDERPETCPVVPPPLVVSDVTSEAVAAILASAPRGLVIDPSELTAWANSLDMYHPGGHGADRGRYISMHDGESIRIHRKTSDPIIVPDPVVCIVGGIQPALLPALNSTPDGLATRILYSYHPDLEPQYISRTLADQAILDAWYFAIHAMLNLDNGVRHVLTLTSGALEAWRDGYDRSVDAAREGGNGHVYSKLPDLAARIALTFAVVETPYTETVSEHSVESAWGVLLGYFAAHASAALSGTAPRSVHPLVRYLETHGGRVSRRDIKHAHIPHVQTDDDIQIAVDAGLVRLEETIPPGGGTPSVWVCLP